MTDTKKIDEFILKATYANASLPYTAKAGVTRMYTVQEILAQNSATVIKIGQQLENMEKSNTGRFSPKGTRKQIPSNSGIYVTDWLEFLEDVVSYLGAAEEKSELRARKKKIQDELNSLKTPEERRLELQAMLEGM